MFQAERRCTELLRANEQLKVASAWHRTGGFQY